MVELDDDWLPGFAATPVIGVSLLTGVGAALNAFVLIIASSPLLSFSDYTSGALLRGVAGIIMTGLFAGAFVVAPACLILTAVGTRLASRHPVVAGRAVWGLVGAVIGGVALSAPFMVWESDGSNIGIILIFGAGCGLFAATMCHLALNVGATP